jgi:hypothetical protein
MRVPRQMINSAKALSCALMLSACAMDLPDAPVDYVVRNDRGGKVAEYADRARALQAGGQRVVIDGLCASACAMIASLPNACVTERGIIDLHWPYLVVTIDGRQAIAGIAPADEFWAMVTPQIARAVRASVFSTTHAGRATYRITAQSAPKYGLRLCGQTRGGRA